MHGEIKAMIRGTIFSTSLFAVLLAWNLARAADPVPGDACSPNAKAQWSGGPDAGGKAYFMVCHSGAWGRVLETAANGYVGVRRAAPKMTLDVAGEMKIGESSLVCGAATEGAIRYSATSKIVEYCNLSTWTPILVNAACDVTPASFTFADQKSLTPSTLIESEIIPVYGTDSGCNSALSVSGQGSPQYRTCADAACTTVLQAWTSSNRNLAMNGPQYLQLRTTTPAVGSATHTVTMTVGGVNDQWQASTTSAGPCGDATPADAGMICADGSVYAGVTPDGDVNMYVARCDVGMSWDGANCTGIRSSLPWNNGNATGRVDTTYNDGNAGAANTAAIVAIDSDSVTPGVQPHQAAQACADLNDHGQTDWYLPAVNELAVIYVLQDGIPRDGNPDPIVSGFATGSYWSSSDNTVNNGRNRSFAEGSASQPTKDSHYLVRCARKD